MAISDSNDSTSAPNHNGTVAASPAAAGPSGSRLEGHVGAQYLLPLLTGGEARGLPGIIVTRVAFQRSSLGYPMDDVIVTGHDRQGRPATLEFQAKRTIAFVASDKNFGDVVARACLAATKPEFDTTRYELAVAIARTSTKIDQYVQEVLRWARSYSESESFFRRLAQIGVAHREMREFVDAFRGRMLVANARSDDAAVWRLLSRFQVLAFDFEQLGSVCAQLARDRCALALVPQHAARAGELWDSLQHIALDVDAAGGALDTPTLRARLISERSYRLAGERCLSRARDTLTESSTSALDDINTTVNGVTIDRVGRITEALAALEHGRYLEIRGAGGVGKSGVLKSLAQRIGIESCVVVIAPNRVPGGGWRALQTQLGCDMSAVQLLTDLAGDGGATLFIDGLDRFDDLGEQATVVDLLRAAAKVPGFHVVVTLRLDFDADGRAWLPAPALKELGEAPPVVISELGDDEMAQLRHADPSLTALLRARHPAEKLVRNLYRLDRLARGVAGDEKAPLSEAQMAWQWWRTGDSGKSTGRLERSRILRSLAAHSLDSSAPFDASASSTDAIAALLDSGSIRMQGSTRVEPAHDVLRDWAVGCLLYEEPQFLADLVLSSPVPLRLVRGVELAARLHAELDPDEKNWRALVERLSAPGIHGSWRRAALLALARSERANDALSRCLPALGANSSAWLADLVRAAVTIDSRPSAPLWAAAGFDTTKFNENFIAPSGPAWINLIMWSLDIGSALPHAAVPQFVDLYNRWCCAFPGHNQISPLLVERMYFWLVEIEGRTHPDVSNTAVVSTGPSAPPLSMRAAQQKELRTAFLLWCKLCPDHTESYLKNLIVHPHRRVLFRQLSGFVGSAPYAAPGALADLFLQVLPETDEEDDRPWAIPEAFPHWDMEYFPASPARPPFFDLLSANKEEGLRLVRRIVAHAIVRSGTHGSTYDDGLQVPLPGGPRVFPAYESYTWSRSQGSSIAASALMALEAWAHMRIEQGEAIQPLLDDILGPEGSPAAFLLVAVDVMLSHPSQTLACIWPFAASAQLLAADFQRFCYDQIESDKVSEAQISFEVHAATSLKRLQNRLSRRRRLDSVLFDYGFYGPVEIRETMQLALQQESVRLGPPETENATMENSQFAAVSALNRLDPENYVQVPVPGAAAPTVLYKVPAQETQLVTDYKERFQPDDMTVAIEGHLIQALTAGNRPSRILEDWIRWVIRNTVTLRADLNKDEQESIERTRVLAAALVMRDGSNELKNAHGDWARARLIEAATGEPDTVRLNTSLPFNNFAIAAVGVLAMGRDDPASPELPLLLSLAAKRYTNMSAVLRIEMDAKRTVRPELARSLVRLGLVSALCAVRRPGDHALDHVADYVARQKALEVTRKNMEQTRQQEAISAELSWLAGKDEEPDWPEIPEPDPPKKRFGLGVQEQFLEPAPPASTSRVFELSAKTAAHWVAIAVELWRSTRPEVLRGLVRHVWPWTAGANGVGCGPDEEPSELAREWNQCYFAAALAAGFANGQPGITEYVFNSLDQLPEKRFLNAAEAVLHALDRLWLSNNEVADDIASWVRHELVQRLTRTEAWRCLAADRSAGVEVNVGGTVAAVFLGEFIRGAGPRCYVTPGGINRIDVLLPMLTQLAEQAARSRFVAFAFLDLLMTAPRASSLAFLTCAVTAWWREQGTNSEFWIDLGIGQRVYTWIDQVLSSGSIPSSILLDAGLTAVVDILVQSGTPSAKRLEDRLMASQNSRFQ